MIIKKESIEIIKNYLLTSIIPLRDAQELVKLLNEAEEEKKEMNELEKKK